MKQKLATLKKIALRDIWQHEALDFTSWLAEAENLDILSQEIGVTITLIKTEASVGKFNVDILAQEEGSSRKIIIENQLESTNHDHLGKIITYASGYDAEIIIWIVKDVREEHQRAIEWLNQHTDEDISFFLIKIELWQIENSSPAPKFEIISSPNEWAKTIKTAPTNKEVTDTKLKQLEFWKNFKTYVHAHNLPLRLQTPRPQHWYPISMGTSEAHISLLINSREQTIGCELYIKNNKEMFHFLFHKKDEIEKELGDQLEWIDASKASRIIVHSRVVNIFDNDHTNEHFHWLSQKTIMYLQTFQKFIQEFKNS